MAGIIAVYALVIAVLIAGDLQPPPATYSLYTYVHFAQLRLYQLAWLYTNNLFPSGFMHLASGLSVGLSGLAAGYSIGLIGDVVCLSLLSGHPRPLY